MNPKAFESRITRAEREIDRIANPNSVIFLINPSNEELEQQRPAIEAAKADGRHVFVMRLWGHAAKSGA